MSVSHLMYITSVGDTVYLRIQFFRKASVCMVVHVLRSLSSFMSTWLWSNICAGT